MKIYFLVAAMCCVASVAEARKPFLRNRSTMTHTEPTRSAAPPRSTSLQAASTPSTPTASTLQSDEQMTKIYGPSILDRS